MVRSASYYTKTISLSILLFSESYLLTSLITQFVVAQNYFSFSWLFTIQTILTMLVMAFTYSLTVGAWDKWEQYVIAPLPIASAMFLAVARYNISYAVISFLVAFFILCFDIYKSSKIMSLLIKFDPKIILRLSTTGILFLFCVLGGLLVMLHTSTGGREINIGEKVAEVVSSPVKNVVQNQLESTLQEQTMLLDGYQLDMANVDPAYLPLLEQFGLNDLDKLNGTSEPLISGLTENVVKEENISNLVEKQINNLVAPYKSFLNPIMALLVFGLFQFYAFFARLLFLAFIDPLFWLAKKTNFFTVELLDVKKEELKF